MAAVSIKIIPIPTLKEDSSSGREHVSFDINTTIKPPNYSERFFHSIISIIPCKQRCFKTKLKEEEEKKILDPYPAFFSNQFQVGHICSLHLYYITLPYFMKSLLCSNLVF